jgi:hypothetical protein
VVCGAVVVDVGKTGVEVNWVMVVGKAVVTASVVVLSLVVLDGGTDMVVLPAVVVTASWSVVMVDGRGVAVESEEVEVDWSDVVGDEEVGDVVVVMAGDVLAVVVSSGVVSIVVVCSVVCVVVDSMAIVVGIVEVSNKVLVSGCVVNSAVVSHKNNLIRHLIW